MNLMPNIVVLVKRVPDTNARIVVSGDRVDLSAVKWVISPYDEFAIETALQHKEADGGTVTALTLGPADSDKVLKDAKAIGVDEIVRVWDDSWAELDSNGIQSALAQAITDLGAEFHLHSKRWDFRSVAIWRSPTVKRQYYKSIHIHTLKLDHLESFCE